MANYCSFRKTKTGFSYSGMLEDCVTKAKNKLERLEKETPYMERRFNEEKRRYDRHCRAITDTKRFIAVAGAKLKEAVEREKETT